MGARPARLINERPVTLQDIRFAENIAEITVDYVEDEVTLNLWRERLEKSGYLTAELSTQWSNDKLTFGKLCP